MPLPIPQPSTPQTGPGNRFYVRAPQDWAIDQERYRHDQALYSLGEAQVIDLCSIMAIMDCSVDNCPKPRRGPRYCHMHNERLRRTGSLERVRGWRPGDTPCAADECDGITRGGAFGYCRKHAARLRKHGSVDVVLSPSGQPVGRGKGSLNKEGYRLLYRNGRQVFEHRWVMEQVLGRTLLDDENVHHKNGIRDDNRPDNLELWSTMQPSGKRVEDLVAFAKEVLERYASADSATVAA